jgi:hypothetical protein
LLQLAGRTLVSFNERATKRLAQQVRSLATPLLESVLKQQTKIGKPKQKSSRKIPSAFFDNLAVGRPGQTIAALADSYQPALRRRPKYPPCSG